MRGIVWTSFIDRDRRHSPEHTELRISRLDFSYVSNSTTHLTAEIERDVTRTFPNIAFFNEHHGRGVGSLLRILQAYSTNKPEIGYCQGLGFVAGTLLMILDEYSAYIMLDKMLTHCRIEGFYDKNLSLVSEYLNAFQKILEVTNPKLNNYLNDLSLVPSMYASQWFLTLYSYSLDKEACMRIWDIMIVDGAKILLQVAIAILETFSGVLYESGLEQCLHIIKNQPRSLNVDTLIERAIKVQCSDDAVGTLIKS